MYKKSGPNDIQITGFDMTAQWHVEFSQNLQGSVGPLLLKILDTSKEEFELTVSGTGDILRNFCSSIS